MVTDEFAENPPHPEFKLRLDSDLSPQAGRGEVSNIVAAPQIGSAVVRLTVRSVSADCTRITPGN
jgi:hypothetical protein